MPEAQKRESARRGGSHKVSTWRERPEGETPRYAAECVCEWRDTGASIGEITGALALHLMDVWNEQAAAIRSGS